MVFSLKKKKNGETDEAALLEQLREKEEAVSFYISAARSLLVMLKQFPLDLKEINTRDFIRLVDDITGKISESRKAVQSKSFFEKSKKNMVSFIEEHKRHLGEREKELKEIIDLLAKSMADLGAENKNYNAKIYENAENLERLTLLDDIKAIKSTLQQEVDQLRESVIEKQRMDDQRISKLSEKVTVLETQLEEAKSESLKDGLTGIYNRMAFDNFMKKLVEKYIVDRTSFSLLMIDIDDFKKINDTYGHQVGDRVILAVVNKCLSTIRADDIPARYGGEEFAVILPGATLRNANKKGKKICKALASTRYAVSGTNGETFLNVTVSIGVSSVKKADTVETIVKRADSALYEAKKQGKNRVICEK
jgi:diguanylate cyclase